MTQKVKVRICFNDNESDEKTIRYVLEQDLEEVSWDCDVKVLE